jgi:tetratricopeptide (TPR) repeat protein
MRQRFVCILVAALVTATGALAQQPAPQPGQQPGQPAQQPAQEAPAPAPANPEEESDFQAFEAQRADTVRHIELGEAFLAKYPDSRYRAWVHGRLAQAYLTRNGDGDIERMYVAGEKSLELNPDNVDVMAMIAWAVPLRIRSSDLDAPTKLQKVEAYSKRVIEMVGAMPKPDAMTEEEFTRAKNDKLAMAHSGLGKVNMHRNKYADMATELEQATQLSETPDPTDLYLLGLAYEQTKRYADAAATFGKCSSIPWSYQQQCKQRQEQAEKQAASQPKP